MKDDYKKYVEDRAKRSPWLLNTLKAFCVGGLICCVGRAITDLYVQFGAELKTAQTLSTVTLIFLAGLITGIGWFSAMGKFAGAGTLVPITGFANAIASPAIENKTEGLIYGTCAKMFVIAGPVIVFGTLASSVYGVIYYIVEKVM
ncbi:MAG: SpoVA/SpoVAEb family sporulation membrane protein [Ruminococcaceae bacterium]|nr:SpoVA/SpoVAEb family sporulation membrane protein [Oscillospiraceae bacterium]